MIDLSDIVGFAKKIALEAGLLIKRERDHNTLSLDFKTHQELVTHADVAADKLITGRIAEHYPSHRLLSEETYTDRTQLENLQDPIWIIDPIDGTVNYAHGQLMACVSIAFAYDGEVQVGIVHNPFLDETYIATSSSAATLNGQAIKHSGANDLKRAIVATGFPYDKSNVAVQVKRMGAVLENIQDIRRLGSAAMDICWVACGRLDGYYESLSPWDFAAARLIAKQAGACCGHFGDVPTQIDPCIYDQNLLITAPELFDPLQNILKQTL